MPEEAPSFLPLGPGSEIGPPVVPDASPVPGPAPYPQGFALDVPVTARGGDGEQEGEKPRAALVRYRQGADALAACWNPPLTFEDRPWKQVTLRVSFKRNGAIQGVPRIPFADQGLTPAARSGLTRSLAAALQRCTPLPFSPGLGGAVAGQMFALRFIEQDPD